MHLTDAHIVRWSPDGDRYVVVMNDNVNIYELETATVTGTVANPKRIASVKFLNVSSLTMTYYPIRIEHGNTKKDLPDFGYSSDTK